MNKLFGAFVLIIILVAAVGFNRGWFSMSTENQQPEGHKIDVNISLDGDKVKAEADTVKEKAVELAEDVKVKAAETKEKAEDILQPDK